MGTLAMVLAAVAPWVESFPWCIVDSSGHTAPVGLRVQATTLTGWPLGDICGFLDVPDVIFPEFLAVLQLV